MKLQLRWTDQRRDLPDILRIERDSFHEPWDEKMFRDVLRMKNTAGFTAETNGKVCGYFVYAIHKDSLSVQNFAVAANKRRQGVGREMAAKLLVKLATHDRDYVSLAIRERNVIGQLFWRACGFKATEVARKFFVDQDAYIFRFQPQAPTVAEWLEEAEVVD